MRFKDLTGTTFGKSVVIGRAESRIDTSGKKRTRWNCLCECGREFITLGDSLTRNPNLVCPECTNNNRSRNNRINIIGKKYGRLTILDVISNTRPTKVLCRCDCGNEHICLQADVISGHTMSCGCLQQKRASESNTKDWTGYVADCGVEFLYQDYKNNKGQWVWKCKCGICGNVFSELPARVNDGYVTSCGCRIQSCGEEYVHSVLELIGANVLPQYTFDDCRSIYKLRFDFAIFDTNNNLLGLIEYDGKQHFEIVEWFGGEEGFRNTQKRDKIKNTYCQQHGIPLLRLPYTLSFNEISTQIYEYYESLTTAGCV